MSFLTYSKNEEAHDDANYFLMKFDGNLNNGTLNSTKEIMMRINGNKFLEFTNNNVPMNFPFYCFQNDNVSTIEDLNFNELKKCQSNSTKTSHKYMVVFLGMFDNVRKHDLQAKEFSKWNKEKPRIKFELTLTNEVISQPEGQMVQIFHKQYQPEISINK